MKQSEFDWVTQDGLKIYARVWEPEQKAKGVICLIHGLGEHSGRYEHVAKFFTHRGYIQAAFDLRGHGKSGGQRGFSASWDMLLDDMSHFLEEIRARYAGLPVFLYGHSLGGTLVVSYGMQRKVPLAGVVSTGPLFKLAFEPPAWKLSLAKMMAHILPSFALSNEIDPMVLSRDSQVGKAYAADPLVHDRFSARLATDLFAEGERALEHAAEFPLPLLIMHGGADRLTSVEASRVFAQRLGERCTLKVWEGFFHEIHNETEQDQVFEFMLDWLDRHTAG